VLPSWYEGFPNVLLEAFAVGLPAIISDIPSHQSIIGNNEIAVTFPPGSPTLLCNKLEQYRSDKKLRMQNSDNAREFVKSYGPAKMAKAYSDFYMQLLGW
jgi:glycosyltransferase involved in cell wall biosynthesis